MQFLRWGVVGVIFFYATILAAAPLLLTAKMSKLRRQGRTMRAGVVVPFIATILLVLTSPLSFSNSIAVKIALAIIALDLSWIVIWFFRSLRWKRNHDSKQ